MYTILLWCWGGQLLLGVVLYLIGAVGGREVSHGAPLFIAWLLWWLLGILLALGSLGAWGVTHFFPELLGV